MSDQRAAGSVEAVFREDRGRLLALLAARLGDLDLAEEVTSDAIETALHRWPVDGVPDKPLAWLLTTARRKAIDRIRRDRLHTQRLAELHLDSQRPTPTTTPDGFDDIPDERLQLFFTCCHPALPPDAQTALTLRFLAGLTTPEVARAFLVPTPTMAQRIVRAKRKIRSARIPFRVPATDELPARLPGVLRVIYLVYTEGHTASYGHDLQRPDLADEAIRLARILHRLLPRQREVTGLLALLLLTDARRNARTDPAGNQILLEEQNRTHWDPDLITEGQHLVIPALTGPGVGPYAVQAAIAALHDEATGIDTTDWPQIVALYDVLHQIEPSPLVALNRAVAIAMRDGPQAGLTLLDDLTDQLPGYHLLPAARADLLRRLGRTTEAAAAYRTALDLAGNTTERATIQRRLTELTDP
ncbi:RNA polymerase sigma factor [Actinoplanes sp. L3-i22]|uniref:RNA polymerase sigma factor n=1 Tax=Actinoplanes sp. L3-i22 TaxID=2836373 RepID=UPI001C759FBC|nr:RNA polymerase sigma factor [Actinoplanes sp. L3-i22]BCY10303.1 RNA polymerase subunit sigma-24 [Actinoplanes sp. L3-i22]